MLFKCWIFYVLKFVFVLKSEVMYYLVLENMKNFKVNVLFVVNEKLDFYCIDVWIVLCVLVEDMMECVIWCVNNLMFYLMWFFYESLELYLKKRSFILIFCYISYVLDCSIFMCFISLFIDVIFFVNFFFCYLFLMNLR